MRKMAWMIPLALLLACGEKEGDDSGASDDSGADDSGADDSGADDSASPEGLDGRWTGTIFFDITDSGSGQSDQCTGVLALDVDMANTEEQFFGDFQCEFSGFLSQFSPMQGSVFGLISQFGEISGSYETGDGPIQGDWPGTIDESNGIEGAFEGSGAAMELELTWTGQIEAQR